GAVSSRLLVDSDHQVAPAARVAVPWPGDEHHVPDPSCKLPEDPDLPDADAVRVQIRQTRGFLVGTLLRSETAAAVVEPGVHRQALSADESRAAGDRRERDHVDATPLFGQAHPALVAGPRKTGSDRDV